MTWDCRYFGYLHTRTVSRLWGLVVSFEMAFLVVHEDGKKIILCLRDFSMYNLG